MTRKNRNHPHTHLIITHKQLEANTTTRLIRTDELSKQNIIGYEGTFVNLKPGEVALLKRLRERRPCW